MSGFWTTTICKVGSQISLAIVSVYLICKTLPFLWKKFLFVMKSCKLLNLMNFRNVSYNNLSGIIPPIRNFSRFSSNRYAKTLVHSFWNFDFCIDYSYLHQLHWKSTTVWKLGRINMWSFGDKGQRYFNLNLSVIFCYFMIDPCFVYMIIGRIKFRTLCLPNELSCFPVMFSRTAVVCMVVGFITLLVMAAIAVYKSNQQRQQLITGSRKSMLGMSLL